jgi:hypothetical protein
MSDGFLCAQGSSPILSQLMEALLRGGEDGQHRGDTRAPSPFGVPLVNATSGTRGDVEVDPAYLNGFWLRFVGVQD